LSLRARSHLVRTVSLVVRSADADDRDERFRAVFDAHAPAVHRYVARRTASAGNAAVDDLVAEVFAVALRRLDDVESADAPGAWLLGVARRIVANHHTTAARREQILARWWRPSAAAVDPADIVVADAAVADALSQLSGSDRELLHLSAWEELTVAEMAVVLDLKASVVSVRLHRARARFAEAFSASSTGPQDRPGSQHEPDTSYLDPVPRGDPDD
jgi:RNA polymerase sigma-70 factor, ECF subfamily